MKDTFKYSHTTNSGVTTQEEFINKHPVLGNVIEFAFHNFKNPRIIENYIKAYITTKQLLEKLEK